MKRTKITRRLTVFTGNRTFHCRLRLCHIFVILLHWSISARISTCVGSTANAVPSIGSLRSRLRQILLRPYDTSESFGFYYGIPLTVIKPIAAKTGEGSSDVAVDEIDHADDISLAKHRYLDEYENIGLDVEKWAETMLEEEDSNGSVDKDGWNEVFCLKSLRSKFDSGKDKSVPFTRQWVKWMKDSREQNADPSDNKKHPCMKLVATIDAPFPIVCRYLSEKNRFREYNSLLIDQEDVEVLTPHSKICWSQSKKLRILTKLSFVPIEILLRRVVVFIEPRDFVTYCRHRWLNDGTQLITNQACDHPRMDQPNKDEDSNLSGMSGYRAFSLRGATYISRCPDFPKKRTKLVLLSHCNCGRDVPEWAVRTAVGILAPIKPFEIIYRIDKGIRKAREELERAEWKSINTPTTTTLDPARSSRPAGIAQMGYACFWPDGGGLVDGSIE